MGEKFKNGEFCRFRYTSFHYAFLHVFFENVNFPSEWSNSCKLQAQELQGVHRGLRELSVNFLQYLHHLLLFFSALCDFKPIGFLRRTKGFLSPRDSFLDFQSSSWTRIFVSQSIRLVSEKCQV